MNSICTRLILTAAILAAARAASAQQEVRLKSGASLQGVATTEGDVVVVKVGDSTLRVSLEDIISVTTATAAELPEPKRLLLTALEAKLLSGSGDEAVGVLAQASRLAPDDPQIAFWYATSLIEGGYGKAANDVLEARREAIEKAYPGRTQRLADRIRQRLKLEELPPDLLERLDSLSDAAAHLPADAENHQFYATFRAVDQHQAPIAKSSIHISHSNDDRFEAFDDGYFLFTSMRRRSDSRDPLRVNVSELGVAPQEFELALSAAGVAMPREIVVHRFDESDRRPVRAHITDAQGSPIAGAKVVLQPSSTRGNRTDELFSSESDDQGQVELSVYPGSYYVNVNATGFHGAGVAVEVKKIDADSPMREVKLYRAIRATIRVAWRVTPMQPGEAASGETTLMLGGGPPPPYHDGQGIFRTVRPVQVADKLMIQFDLNAYGGYPMAAPGSTVWVGSVDASAEQSDEAGKTVRDKFDGVDLEKLAELKDQFMQLDLSRMPVDKRAPGLVPAEPGKVYVGKLPHRDMRTGQPGELALKLFVEEMDVAAPAEE